MGLFNKKDTDMDVVIIDNLLIYCDENIARHVRKIEAENNMLNMKVEELEHELNIIKPVLENKELRDAVSVDCDACKYVVRSRWDGRVLKCRKGVVCKDFEEAKIND